MIGGKAMRYLIYLFGFILFLGLIGNIEYREEQYYSLDEETINEIRSILGPETSNDRVLEYYFNNY